MSTVRVSPTFEVSIPPEVRERVPLKVGQRVEVLLYNDRIELIPIRPMQEMRGFAPGIDPTVERKPDRT